MKLMMHHIWLLGTIGLLLTQCGAYGMKPAAFTSTSVPTVAAPPAGTPTTSSLSSQPDISPTTPVPQRVEDVFGNQQAPQVPAPTPLAQLNLLLADADAELQAAKQSQTLDEARRHSQIAINILVGPWGRWHDRTATKDTRVHTTELGGVLPPYTIPTRANGDNTTFPIGAALAASATVDVAGQQAIQRTILGDAVWATRPRDGYDGIAQAVAAAASSTSSIATLRGGVPQAVAWARVIVSKAHTLDQARSYAEAGSAALQPAIKTARQL